MKKQELTDLTRARDNKLADRQMELEKEKEEIENRKNDAKENCIDLQRKITNDNDKRAEREKQE